MATGDTVVRFVTADDKASWLPLFRGYATFYQTEIDATVEDRVWGWLNRPDHVLEGLLAWNPSNEAVGMAHIRECPRPLSGRMMGFLDDMFVVPEARGSGVAEALFEAMKTIAEERSWPVFRWLTQHYNERGRGFYDKYTEGPSDFIMYQWKF